MTYRTFLDLADDPGKCYNLLDAPSMQTSGPFFLQYVGHFMFLDVGPTCCSGQLWRSGGLSTTPRKMAFSGRA